jgi:hypothetical protein
MGEVNGTTSLGVAVALVVAQLSPLPVLGLAPLVAQSDARWGGSGGSNNQGFAGEITCRSQNGREESCYAQTDNRVRLLQQYSSTQCVEGRNWRYTRSAILVTGGCQARFGYGYGNGNGNGGGWGGGSGGGSGGGWGGGNNQGFAGEITCRSQNGREQSCYAQTDNRVRLLQQYSGTQCIEGRNWRYTRNAILVTGGCQARFGYGYGNGNGGGNGGGWGGGGSNQGFAGQLECRSQDNRYRRCSANTENRVELLRQFSSSDCSRGRSWGFDRNSIWVDRGCQARFGYGYGNVRGDTSDDNGGSNTGAVVGGVALAAGLIALLAAAGKSSSSSKSASAAPASATINADMAKFPSEARSSGQACLNEAARQVGATGGSAITLDGIDAAQRSGEGWMILARATGTYNGQPQKLSIDCRATGDKVTAFDVR